VAHLLSEAELQQLTQLRASIRHLARQLEDIEVQLAITSEQFDTFVTRLGVEEEVEA